MLRAGWLLHCLQTRRRVQIDHGQMVTFPVLSGRHPTTTAIVPETAKLRARRGLDESATEMDNPVE